MLDGEVVRVRWTDGDTFRIRDGELKGTRGRVTGINALEDFGPVHSWGTWTREELYELARAPEKLLASRGWACSRTGETDGYDRLLVECPELALSLVSEGLAMVFAVDADPSPRLLDAQRGSQAAGKGMWRKGVPEVIVTSVHSAEEGRGYNRVVDTHTGISRVRPHDERYDTCQKVCEGAADRGSCMVFVPFGRRYKDNPDCLR